MQHSVAAAHGTELVALLHGGAHLQHAHDQLRDFIQDLVIEAPQPVSCAPLDR